MDSQPNCPICLDSFVDLTDISACACGHTFHYDCIVNWGKRCQEEAQPSLCPTCKKRFEINSARGIIKKLYFSFDLNRSKEQKDLQKQLEQSEASLIGQVAKVAELDEKLKHLDAMMDKENVYLKKRLEEAERPRRADISTVQVTNYRKGPVKSLRPPRPTNIEKLPSFYDTHQYEMRIASDPGYIGLYKFMVPIPTIHSAFFRHLFGARGKTKNFFEEETRTKLCIPRLWETAAVFIEGNILTEVDYALTRILNSVDDIRSRMSFTHFISFPINGSNIGKGLNGLIREISSYGDEELSDDLNSFFQCPLRINLTIGTLVLLDDDEIDQAKKALEWCRWEIIEPIVAEQGLPVSLHGLQPIVDPLSGCPFYSKENGREDCCLHAQVEGRARGKLQKIANQIVNHFQDISLMPRKYKEVPLKAVVMNTLFLESKNQIDPPDRTFNIQDRESFDTEWIVEEFGGYNFGDHTVSEVHLSTRNMLGADEYYLPVSKFKF